MLDDLNVISQRDPQGFLGFAAEQPAQLRHNFGIAAEHFSRPIKNIVFTGMGGSVLVAEFARTWPRVNAPYVVSKEYALPSFVNEDTLVIAASYSGNTEETLEALEHARAAGAQIAVITHGGKLLENAEKHGDILAKLADAPQPRAGVFSAYRALVEILEAAQLVDPHATIELENIVESLEAAAKTWAANVPEANNYAKQLAQQMAGKTPIIYAGPLMAPAAWKWKIDVNENAKNTAWHGVIPEFNHNEFIGWSSHPVEKPFAVIDLLSSFEHERVKKRFEVSDRLLSGMRPASINVDAKGQSVVEQLLYLVLLGDHATTYLAILNGVNPTPVDLVEKFKKELV